MEQRDRDQRVVSDVEYRTIEESIGFGFWKCDGAGKITNLSPSFLKLVGCTIDSCAGSDWAKFLHPDDAGKVMAMWKRCIEKRVPWEQELRIPGAQGDRYVLSRGVPMQDERAGTICWAGINLDITSQKRKEIELLEREERFRMMISNSPDRVFHQDRDLIYTWISNPPTGLTDEDVVGKTDFDFLDREEAERLRSAKEAVLETGVGRRVEIRIDAGGKKRYYDVGLEPRRDARGRLLGVAGYMREITSRKQMEERLRQAHDELEMRVERRTSELQDAYGKLEAEINERKHTEQELKRVMTAISQSGDSVLIVDTDGIVLYANPAFFSMSGYSAGETLGRNVSSLKSHLSDDDLYETVRATVKNGRSWTGLIAGKKKSGSTYEVEATVSPVRDDEDRVTNYVTVGRDVTEKKKLERQLRQAQKMEAIGTLAGGIAHDFNNIIAAIIGFAEMAIDDTDENTQIRRFLEQILKSGIRGRDLVKQILSFSRGSDIERRPVQVSLIVKEALKLLRASIPATIEIQQDIDPDSGIVMADATEIHQVVINLVTNAAHAMRSKGGILKVAVCNTAGGVDEGSGPAALGPGRYLRLTVSDTGQGMDKGIMERIFDPFFTTKEKGEGTGLGLSVVHGIVQSHEGVITVRSKPGRGSTFEVYLPTIEEPCSSDEDLGTIPEGRESILLIDDEETLIEIGTEMLERLGYSVTATTNSIEALRIFKKRPHSFDLVITDQAMPRMSGLELAREMISVRDDIPIILCTGFSEAVSKEQVPNLGIREFLLKPLVRKEMAEAIRRVLDGAKVPVRTVRAGQIQGKE